MPEGDTIHTIAGRMRELAQDQTVCELWIRNGGAINEVVGKSITGVDAVGKHMFIDFSSGHGLRVHLGLRGRWRWFKANAELPDWTATADIRLATMECTLACTRANEVQYGTQRYVRRRIQHLGPDLTRPDLDWSRAWLTIERRLDGHECQAISELLLNQTIACGIGNVFRSEILFIERCAPSLRPRDLPKASVAKLYQTAHILLSKNVGPGARRTVEVPHRRTASAAQIGRLWVYGRVNQPCRECGTGIMMVRTGTQQRSLYYCPQCQEAQTAAESKTR